MGYKVLFGFRVTLMSYQLVITVTWQNSKDK